MKQGWIGAVAGLAIGLTAVFMTQRGGDQGPRKPTLAEGSAAIATCDPGGSALPGAYTEIAAPVQSTSRPNRRRRSTPPAARSQTCSMRGSPRACASLEVQHQLGSAFSDPRLPQVRSHIEHLHVARARLEDLITVLQSSQASDAQQKLDALDAAMQ